MKKRYRYRKFPEAPRTLKVFVVLLSIVSLYNIHLPYSGGAAGAYNPLSNEIYISDRVISGDSIYTYDEVLRHERTHQSMRILNLLFIPFMVIGFVAFYKNRIPLTLYCWGVYILHSEFEEIITINLSGVGYASPINSFWVFIVILSGYLAILEDRKYTPIMDHIIENVIVWRNLKWW